MPPCDPLLCDICVSVDFVPMRTFKLTLAYDGTNYAGWQLQPGQTHAARNARAGAGQDHRRIDPRRRQRADRRGRARAGAGGQLSRARRTSSPRCCKKRSTPNLPRDMAVVAAEVAPDGFHATRDAVRKLYRYTIDDGRLRDVFRPAVCLAAIRRRWTRRPCTAPARRWWARTTFPASRRRARRCETSVRTVYSLRSRAVARGERPADYRRDRGGRIPL